MSCSTTTTSERIIVVLLMQVLTLKVRWGKYDVALSSDSTSRGPVDVDKGTVNECGKQRRRLISKNHERQKQF